MDRERLEALHYPGSHKQCAQEKPMTHKRGRVVLCKCRIKRVMGQTFLSLNSPQCRAPAGSGLPIPPTHHHPWERYCLLEHVEVKEMKTNRMIAPARGQITP